MRRLNLMLAGLMLLTGCGGTALGPTTSHSIQRQPTQTLAEARNGFETRLPTAGSAPEPVPDPPANVFQLVRFPSAVGELAAYLTPDPQDSRKHPAIIWITGGDCNSIGKVWEAAPASNDQTAAAYRKAGIVMMFPSLRGGNDNPGIREGYLGEVDDVVSAADFLAQQPYVDPQRIYLGGHSTGGTLVMLVAECSDRFRAVFSFGPVDDVRGYPPQYRPFNASDAREAELRSPGFWLHSIRSPVFAIEGTSGNIESLQAMARMASNPQVQFLPVRGADHFNILAPANKLIAGRILLDTGSACNLMLTSDELAAVVVAK